MVGTRVPRFERWLAFWQPGLGAFLSHLRYPPGPSENQKSNYIRFEYICKLFLHDPP